MSLAIGPMSHPAMQGSGFCRRLAFKYVPWGPVTRDMPSLSSPGHCCGYGLLELSIATGEPGF